tara:strand:- start:47 stop:970 length:924 start_codon:yes stop_codon:yes gene_type:complete
MKKKKILIIGGGYSKEREISLMTAKSVERELCKNKKYIIKKVDPSYGLISTLKKYKPDVVFNALHGQFGEDGYIQSILESQKIKYTHSGVLSSFMAMDKEISKKIFIKNNILTPKFIKFIFEKKLDSKLIKLVQNKLQFPVVVKPLNEGSSVNVYICNQQNFIKNLRKLKTYKEILIEKYIPGREIQVAIMGNKKIGAIELKPKRKFYDYEAKYNPKAKTQHIIPVQIDPKQLDKVNNIALKAHKLLKCKGVTRSDFRYFKGKFYLLEVNTQPGMTSLSLVPEIAKHNKISFLNLIEWMISDASVKR